MPRILAALALPLLLAADWPQILGPNRDGRSPETKLLWDWTAKPPAVACSGWQRPAPTICVC